MIMHISLPPRSQSLRPALHGVCLALMALACGDVSEPSMSAGGSAGSASAGTSGSGGGSMSNGGNGGSAITNGGSGGGAGATLDPDAGMAGGGSGGASEFMYPDGCPIPDPIPVPGQVVAIQSVNFNTSEVVLRNVTDSELTLDGGQQGWQWCNFPNYGPVLANVITLDPGETVAIILVNQSGDFWPLYPGEPGDANEMAIYDSAGGFMNAERMLNFVTWGAGSNGGRESVAATAGRWTFGERVEISDGHAGFVATGATNRGSGYTSVPSRCLVAPPNPPDAELQVPD